MNLIDTLREATKPSELLTLAMMDLESVLVCDNVTFDLKTWVKVAPHKATISVCFAGAVMLHRFDILPVINTSEVVIAPSSLNDLEITKKLWSINDLAQGAFNSAFNILGYIKPKELEYKEMIPYNKGSETFKNCIDTLIQDLKHLGY